MRRGEEGFTLVEALVSTGLLAMTVMGFMATIAVSLNVVNKVKVNDDMDVIAHNALTDLYAVSVYDGATALAGRTLTYTVKQPSSRTGGLPTVYTVNVSISPAGVGEIVASARVSDALGHTAAMEGILVQAAPAPGSEYAPGYTVLKKPL